MTAYKGPEIFRRKQTTININHPKDTLSLNKHLMRRLRKLGRRRFKTEIAKRFKKDHPWTFKERRIPKIGRVLKVCPICGKSRDAGYIRCCGDCIWVFEFREHLDYLLKQISSLLRNQGGEFTWIYRKYSVDFRISISVYCDIEKVESVGSELVGNLKARTFHVNRKYSLKELKQAEDLKRFVMDEVVYLFRTVSEEKANYVDKNSKAYEVAGLMFPTGGGNWRK